MKKISIEPGAYILDYIVSDRQIVGTMRMILFGTIEGKSINLRTVIESNDKNFTIKVNRSMEIGMLSLISAGFGSNEFFRFMKEEGLPVILTPIHDKNQTEVLILSGSPFVWVSD